MMLDILSISWNTAFEIPYLHPSHYSQCSQFNLLSQSSHMLHSGRKENACNDSSLHIEIKRRSVDSGLVLRSLFLDLLCFYTRDDVSYTTSSSRIWTGLVLFAPRIVTIAVTDMARHCLQRCPHWHGVVEEARESTISLASKDGFFVEHSEALQEESA